jgi:hypothetical protein
VRQICSNHEWIEDNEGVLACFFCGKDGSMAPGTLLTVCVECGIQYGGQGGRGLCLDCSDLLGMHEEDIK